MDILVYICPEMGYKYNKEAILNIGFDVFRRNGYHNVGINQILKESGIPKGSFYNFFESKEDFAQQVIQNYGKGNCKWIKAQLEAFEGSALGALKSFYTTLIAMNEEDKYAGGCLVNNMSMEVGRINDTLGAEANEQIVSWLQVFAAVITKGQEEGQITDEFTALELAEYLHAGFYGALSRSKVTRNRVYMDSWYRMTFEFIQA